MSEFSIYLPGGMDCAATFASGQAFRWRLCGDEFCGIAGGYYARVHMQGDNIIIKTDGDEAFWCRYFAAQQDYTALRDCFCKDETLAACVHFAEGIRVLRQPFFETLCTFIISQNNNIPRITGIVQRMCETFGTCLPNGEYTFPAAETLACKTVEDLAPLRSGFRAKYLLDAARQVANGTVNEKDLEKMDIDTARKCLIEIYGVGQKVADCVLLYGLGRIETVPIDVHMRRAMENLFPNGLPLEVLPYAGIAQQFIFHYTRLGAQTHT
ncbi:MAG: DNA glycosylase [Oscillospiraceae bacterium]